MIDESITSFYGLPVVAFDDSSPLADVNQACRISMDWDQYDEGVKFSDLFAKLREDPKASELRALVIGDWGGAAEGKGAAPVVEALVAAHKELRSLEALFIGEMISEECEISWIEMTDVSPLWNAYPNLREFRVRGGQGLHLGQMRLSQLQRLIIETGGMPARVLDRVCRAELPELEHLELWLGSDGYGWDGTVEGLDPILSGELFPKLKYLGLRNSEEADAVAVAVADAPILDRIETLDLSLGALGDEGAKALVESPRVRKLTKLDIHHHFVSDELVAQLHRLGIAVNSDDKQEADEWDGEEQRFIFVSE